MADATIKENALPPHTSETATQLAARFLRLVGAQNTGSSELIQIANLILKISNIDGLQTALDNIVPKVTGALNQIPVFDGSGSLIDSGVSVKTFDTIEALDAITAGGFYTPSASVEMPIVGRVDFVLIGGGHRFIFGRTNGVWHQQYSTAWSLPRYVGGSFNCIPITYAEAVNLISNQQLSPGAKYRLVNADSAPNLYQDLGLYITAATSTTFEPEGSRIALIPKESQAGLFDGRNWGGVWNPYDSSVTVGYYYVAFGKVFKSLTGVLGTVVDFSLDTTNWELQHPMMNIGTLYVLREMGIIYRFTAQDIVTYPYGYIVKQWDDKGITLGEDIEPTDGFNIDMNDWTHSYHDAASNITLARFFMNDIIYNTTYYRNIFGTGVISYNYDSYMSNITMNGSNIFISGNHDGFIVNSVLKFEAKILNNGGTGGTYGISGSEIGGEIEGNGNAPTGAYTSFNIIDSRIGKSGDIKRSYGTVQESVIDGDIKDVGNVGAGNIVFAYSTIESNAEIHDTPNVTVQNSSVVKSGVDIKCLSLSMDNSIIDVSINNVGGNYVYVDAIINNTGNVVDGSIQTIRQNPQNRIISAFKIGAGTFTVSQGTSYVLPIISSGMSVVIGRQNGITIDSVNRRFVIKYSGWYVLNMTTSSTVSNACIAEVMAHLTRGGSTTPILNWYNKKKYNSTDSWQVTSLPRFPVYLEANDIIDIRYKHDYTGTITVTLGQIDIALEYYN